MPDCPNCGQEIRENVSYCRHCGAEQWDSKQSVDTTPKEAKSEKDCFNWRGDDKPDSIEDVGDSDYVSHLVSKASGQSVTKEVLLNDFETKYTSSELLNDEKLIDYLDTDEVVEYVFWNEKGGIEIDSNLVSPDRNYMTLGAITDKRILVIVGHSEGNEDFNFALGNLSSIELSGGISKHVLSFSSNGEKVSVNIAPESICFNEGFSVDHEKSMNTLSGIADFLDRNCGNTKVTLSESKFSSSKFFKRPKTTTSKVLFWGGLVLLILGRVMQQTSDISPEISNGITILGVILAFLGMILIHDLFDRIR